MKLANPLDFVAAVPGVVAAVLVDGRGSWVASHGEPERLLGIRVPELAPIILARTSRMGLLPCARVSGMTVLGYRLLRTGFLLVVCDENLDASGNRHLASGTQLLAEHFAADGSTEPPPPYRCQWPLNACVPQR